MRIQVVSDLHLEFGDFDVKNGGADVLVLAGDILTAKHLYNKDDGSDTTNKLFIRFRDFLRRVSKEFKWVVYVPGNHEYYGFKWTKTTTTLHKYCAQFPNVIFMNAEFFVLEDVTFIGGTLWTDFDRGNPLAVNMIQCGMTDYKAITQDISGYSKLQPKTVVDAHRAMLSLISGVASATHKCVVVSHHAPSAKSVDPAYASSKLNYAYYSDLDNFISEHPSIKLWIHGHMHDPADYTICGTRVVANPRGYIGYERRAHEYTGQEMIVEI